MSMGIVNAGNLPVYDVIDPVLLRHCEDLIWNRKASAATDNLISYARVHSNDDDDVTGRAAHVESWREQGVEERIHHSLVKVATR